MKKEFEIVSVNSQKIDDVVSFLNLALGQGNEAYRKSKAMWNWKHLNSPFGSSYGIAAIDHFEKQIVGIRVLMYWSVFNHNEEKKICARAVDTATHPDFKRKGIFSTLTLQAINDLKNKEVAAIFNTPNQKSKAGYLKLGWEFAGGLHLYIKVLRPIGFFKGIAFGRKKNSLQFIPEWGEIFSPGILSFKQFSERFHANKIDEFLSKVDQNRKMVPGWRIKKDYEYLNWRYGNHPNVDYGFLSITENNQLVGMVILRRNSRFGMREVVISEFFVENNNRVLNKLLFREIKRNVNADYLIAHFNLNTPELSNLKRVGFIKVPLQKIDFTIKELSEKKDLFNKLDFWNFSLGDLELF